MRIYEIEIGYKSGNKQTMWFESFQFKRTKVQGDFEDTVEYKPTGVENSRPIFLNLDEIEYISQISSKEV